jgi:glycine cleavage system regulatory protein
MSGGQLFKAAATLHLPGDLPVRSVRSAIEAVAADLMVDIVIKDD